MKSTIKIFKVLVLLATICFSQISCKANINAKDTSKKTSKISTKNDSWETGFTCPKIRVQRHFGKEKSTADVVEDIRIMGPHILSPSNDIDRSGLAFEFRQGTTPFGHFSDLLVKHPNPALENIYILPYRKIYKDFYSTKRGMKKIWIIGGGRHIVLIGWARGQKLRESGKAYRYRIKITLPYEGNVTKVSESEISKILYGINHNRIDIYERLNDNKLGMLKALHAYKRDRGILEDYTKGNKDFQALRLKYKEKLLHITTRFYTRAIASAMYLAQNISLKEERGKLSAEIFQLSNKVHTQSNQIENIDKEIETVKSSHENAEKMKREIILKKDETRSNMIKLLKDISSLDPEVNEYATTLAENIKTNHMYNLDKIEIAKKLGSLIPC